jgi:hypothetical protein
MAWEICQSILHPDSRSIAFKSFTQNKNLIHVERWSEGMVIFQYISKLNILIMNYNHKDKIWPIHFLNAERLGYRVPEILWSWSQDPTKEMYNYTNSIIPCAIHKSYESLSHKFDGVDWEPKYATWSNLQDPSRQDVL